MGSELRGHVPLRKTFFDAIPLEEYRVMATIGCWCRRKTFGNLLREEGGGRRVLSIRFIKPCHFGRSNLRIHNDILLKNKYCPLQLYIYIFPVIFWTLFLSRNIFLLIFSILWCISDKLMMHYSAICCCLCICLFSIFAGKIKTLLN